MINLLDLLKIKSISLENYKIHLATTSGGEVLTPYDAFISGSFKRWQEGQNKKNFECGFILSLVSIGSDKWVFAGVYKVLGVTKGIDPPYLYHTELLPDQEDLIGKVIVKYKRQFRQAYLSGPKYSDILEVFEIRPEKLSIKKFPGYTDVIIPYSLLKIVVAQQVPEWKAALSSVKGIYLIVDTSNGKMYVGEAPGENRIWQRWESYAKSGHGSDVELVALLKENGVEYADNFQYSILEFTDSHATDEYISTREVYWKDALLSRKFGYNKN